MVASLMGVSWGNLGIRRLVAAPGALVVLVLALLLAGCGGSSSSSSERAKLANEVSAQLQSSQAPADLVGCVSATAKGLPLDQLRAVASAGANPSPATKQIAVHMVATCVSQGKGISALHSLIAGAIVAAAPGTLPAAYTKCVVAKANATTPSQLSQLIEAYASEDQATAQAQAHAVGVGLGRECLGSPGVLASFRAIFVGTFKKGFATSHYSPAFQACLLRKISQVPESLLKQSALNPSGASNAGEAFGRNAARACLASGIKP
jgi:hypothetical protein